MFQRPSVDVSKSGTCKLGCYRVTMYQRLHTFIKTTNLHIHLQRCWALFLFLVLFSPLTTAMPIFTILNVSVFQVFNVTSAHNHHSSLREFSDKFQYDVISSSLLSTSITAPSSTRRRSSSEASHPPPDDPDPKPRTKRSRPVPSRPVEQHSAVGSLTLFCLCCISLSFDLLCVLIGTAFYYVESHTVQPRNLPDYITPVGP